jgi:hypothetical protein
MAPMTRSPLRGLLPAALLGLTLAATAPALQAQAAPAPRRNALTINPLGIPFEYVSAEYERVVSAGFTLGVGASHLGIDDGSYTTGELKGRYYPNEEAMRGFSVGLAAGITRVGDRESVCDAFACRDLDRRFETRPTLAVMVDYNWMLGRSKRFVVGTGLGAKRIFTDDSNWSGPPVAYPTARLQLGIRY